MKTLYPAIKPFRQFFLSTATNHSIYVEQSGNPKGLAVIFLHGGPSSGTKPEQRQFFNPKKYHIILMDQRGCGKSLPFGELKHNTTQDLIADVEAIRRQLKIKQWLLFGGSWGATLAILYAQKYPSKVVGMVIRGVFLARKKDLSWFIKDGAGKLYPNTWQKLLDIVPILARDDLLQGLYNVVFSTDESAKKKLAKTWIDWNGQLALGQDYQEYIEPITKKIIQQVQMEIYYAYNKYFITENQILNSCANLQNLTTIIIHGQDDLVCPIEAGDSLALALPNAQYNVLPKVGHVANNARMIDALVEATDSFNLKG